MRLELRFWSSAPGRIRTRDPLLRRYRRSFAGRRLSSLCEPSSSIYCRWLSEGVAWRLPALALRLAPRNLLAFAKCLIDENNIDGMVPCAAVASLARHPVTLCHRQPWDSAYRADVREWPFALRREGSRFPRNLIIR
jgi:hypothetical protein